MAAKAGGRSGQSPHGSQAGERDKEQDMALKGKPPVTYFLRPDPTSSCLHHLPK